LILSSAMMRLWSGGPSRVMVAVGGKVGRGMGVAVAGGAAVGARVGRLVSRLAVSVAVGSVAEVSVETAVTVLTGFVEAGLDCPTVRAQMFNPPKQRRSSRKGKVMRMARFRFEKRRDFPDDSSIRAAFYHKKTFQREDAKDFFLYAFCPFAYFALKIFDEFCLKGTGLPVAVFVNYSTILA
jgi:hypothetical protein